MKYIIAIFLTFSALHTFGACINSSDFSSTIDDAIQKVDSVKGNIELHNALHTLLGINYIRHNLSSYGKQGYKFCIGAIPLERNIYRYTRYLVTVNMQSHCPKKSQTMNLLFQNASVQAIEGNKRKPWIGLDRSHVDSILSKMRISASKKMTPSKNLVELVKQSSFGPTTATGKKTISLITLPDGKILAGWLKNVGHGYGHSPNGVLIDTKKSEIHQLSSVYNDVLVEADTHLRDVQPRDAKTYTNKLKELTY